MTGTITLRNIRRLFREEHGSQLVEFAVSILALLAVLFGIMDFSRAMYSYHFMSYAAQEGARYAIVHGASWSSSCNTSAPPNFTMSYGCKASSGDVQNYVKSLVLPLIDASSITVNTSWPGTTPGCTSSCSACSPTNSKGCYVQVKTSYTFNFIMPFLPKSSGLSFSATSEKVIQE